MIIIFRKENLNILANNLFQHVFKTQDVATENDTASDPNILCFTTINNRVWINIGYFDLMFYLIVHNFKSLEIFIRLNLNYKTVNNSLSCYQIKVI
jgi:hypothetical protein